ncbi:FAD-dependent oxidoreductase, partial [Patescibacteria group bacterium]|nr:FAD-dependent oxidoreductase [Patescibacteria group bacterium]
MEKRKYQLIIAGAGPSGLTAAIYAKRAGIDTLILEKLSPGGQAQLSERIENYPGFSKPISGQKLMGETLKQVKNLKLEPRNEEVEKVEDGKEKKIYTDAGNIYQTLGLIVATGANPMSLGIPGEKELTGKGVSYCATCDAPFFRDEDVLVVGGGNTAMEEALYLANFAKKVYLVHRRDRLRAEKILQDRIFANPKI